MTHQGAGYFIAAPQGGAPGDIPVYDVAAKVQGVFIEADVIEVETDNGQLKVDERYFVHNTSSPPTTQWSKKSFEIVLPEDAVLNEVGAQRPGGLPTSIKMDPDGPKGHYSFNFPIQPDDGDKDTLFQISYSLPYSSGKYTFKSVVTLPADNVAVLMPKSMSFTAGSGASFKSVQEDPGIQTWLLKNATPGKTIEFTVSGTGSMPREAQSAQGGAQAPVRTQGCKPAASPAAASASPSTPPIRSPNTSGGFSAHWRCCLSAAAAFLLRKPADRRRRSGIQPQARGARPAQLATAAVCLRPPQPRQARTPRC